MFFTTIKKLVRNYKKIIFATIKKSSLKYKKKICIFFLFFCFLSGHSIKWCDSPGLKKVLILLIMPKKRHFKAIKCSR